jgi:hypothetical protein
MNGRMACWVSRADQTLLGLASFVPQRFSLPIAIERSASEMSYLRRLDTF